MMVFKGRGFTSILEGKTMTLCLVVQHIGKVHRVLPLVPEDKRSCFSQGERFAVQLPLDRTLTLQK